jgi:hypothetical protein
MRIWILIGIDLFFCLGPRWSAASQAGKFGNFESAAFNHGEALTLSRHFKFRRANAGELNSQHNVHSFPLPIAKN